MTDVPPDLGRAHSHPSLGELEEAARLVTRWSLDHFTSLSDQLLGNGATPQELQALLGESAPESGRPFAEVLGRFQKQIIPFAYKTNHPRFLAFVPGGPAFPSVLGDWLCSAANFFCGVWLEASGPTQVELTVLDWFKEWVGYPSEARGILTSGGSEANLTALVTARERVPFADRRRMVLYVSDQRHWSIDRAAKVIGLHPDRIQAISSGPDLKFHVPALLQQIEIDRREGHLPWAVIANAGATNTGTVDPMNDLADLCAREKLWLHVDAAYGWAAILTPEGKRELAGIERADSITLDPHKWLSQTFEAGCLLVRNGPLLEEAFSMRPDYLQDVTPRDGEINFADHGIALTRRFLALKIWMSVQVLGKAWFRDLADRCLRLAAYAQARLEKADCFEIMHPRNLSIVCFRFRSTAVDETQWDRLNEALVQELRDSRRAFLSTTRIRNQVALRMCFINWRTTTGDIDEIVALLREIGQKIAERET
ncbi:MAG: aminotransferase class V-fold PLP-dependent enzyme [Planctomycetes bacterium]|nr:aminotransferase class V-fold PLP-dependent enzyme [Planctomycetota bacterium]